MVRLVSPLRDTEGCRGSDWMLVEGRTAGKLRQMLKSSQHAPEVTKGNEGGGCCCLVAWEGPRARELHLRLPSPEREERTCDLSTEHCRGGGARRWRRAPLPDEQRKRQGESQGAVWDESPRGRHGLREEGGAEREETCLGDVS